MRPPAGPPAIPAGAASPLAPCHPMRPCVALDVNQRNTSEVVAALVNRCDRTVTCVWCPVRGAKVDKTGCRRGTLSANESLRGREQSLWYEGFDGIVYDCTDASDETSCLDMPP